MRAAASAGARPEVSRFPARPASAGRATRAGGEPPRAGALGATGWRGLASALERRSVIEGASMPAARSTTVVPGLTRTTGRPARVPSRDRRRAGVFDARRCLAGMLARSRLARVRSAPAFVPHEKERQRRGPSFASSPPLKRRGWPRASTGLDGPSMPHPLQKPRLVFVSPPGRPLRRGG